MQERDRLPKVGIWKPAGVEGNLHKSLDRRPCKNGVNTAGPIPSVRNLAAGRPASGSRAPRKALLRPRRDGNPRPQENIHTTCLNQSDRPAAVGEQSCPNDCRKGVIEFARSGNDAIRDLRKRIGGASVRLRPTPPQGDDDPAALARKLFIRRVPSQPDTSRARLLAWRRCQAPCPHT